MGKFREYTSWKAGDFVLQLSVVILGIIVTFAGSNAITRHAQSKEIATTLQFVQTELEMNLRNLKEMHNNLLQEKKACVYLLGYENEPEKISADSLSRYMGLPFVINSFSYTSDALEMLKMSSLTQQIRDKEMVLQIVSAYNELKKTGELVKWYYGMKSKYTDRLEDSESFARDALGVRKKAGKNLHDYLFNKQNFNEMYVMYWNYPPFRNLLLFISGGVNLRTFHNAEVILEQAIASIQEKYRRK